ncbi:hypothetical protein [Caloramator sp. ALD01]|uniref:hypothetical protein n=1 Tax=Caloramator sp. ALD01 TaxID=1031288 RepID=UPI00042371FC|nr:hypothetical protein [Caloramator sp. ALD01]
MKYKILNKNFNHALNEFFCEIDFFVEGENEGEYLYYATDGFSLQMPVTLEQINEKIQELGLKHKKYYELQQQLLLEGEI